MAPQARQSNVITDREFTQIVGTVGDCLGRKSQRVDAEIEKLNFSRQGPCLAFVVVVCETATTHDTMGERLEMIRRSCAAVRHDLGLHFCLVHNRGSRAIRAYFARDRELFTRKNLRTKSEDDVIVLCACE